MWYRIDYTSINPEDVLLACIFLGRVLASYLIIAEDIDLIDWIPDCIALRFWLNSYPIPIFAILGDTQLLSIKVWIEVYNLDINQLYAKFFNL